MPIGCKSLNRNNKTINTNKNTTFSLKQVNYEWKDDNWRLPHRHKPISITYVILYYRTSLWFPVHSMRNEKFSN